MQKRQRDAGATKPPPYLLRLSRGIRNLFRENIQKVVPAFLVPPCQLMVRKVGMHQCHPRAFSLFLEGKSDHRLLSQGVWRHPGMLNSARSLDFRESAVMGRPFLALHIKEPVHFRIQKQLESRIPEIAGDLWI